jgi:hypothetical protein
MSSLKKDARGAGSMDHFIFSERFAIVQAHNLQAALRAP